jgi:DNA-binding IclR family transcriptional regulator
VLVELAQHPDGIGLDGLAQRLRSPKPTVHRALASLRRARLADQVSRGVYRLGDEYLRLAFQHHAARPEGALLEPALRQLAERYGETAHYAELDGTDVVYRAKVDPPSGSVRLTSQIGGRNPAATTAVGKLLLAGSATGPSSDGRRARSRASRPSGRSCGASVSAATPSTTRRTRWASTASPSPPAWTRGDRPAP